MGLTILGVYIFGFVLSAIIFSIVFPYQDGDWEILCDKIVPKDEEVHKMNILMLSVIWPLVLVFIIMLLPVLLLKEFTDWCYEKFSKK